MIKLHGYQPVWELADGSIFVTKVDCYLRMAGLPFTLTAAVSLEALQRAPLGMIPYVEDGDRKIADSDFIIEYLRTAYGDRLGEFCLAPAECAIAHSMQRMLEENLYWVLLYLHWMETGVHKASMAEALRLLQKAEELNPETQIQHVVRGYLYAKGIGRQSKEELYRLGNADLSALSAYLGDKPYFTGDHPVALDASAYAVLSRIFWGIPAGPMQLHARGLNNLEAYCVRMARRYYVGVAGAREAGRLRRPMAATQHGESDLASGGASAICAAVQTCRTKTESRRPRLAKQTA